LWTILIGFATIDALEINTQVGLLAISLDETFHAKTAAWFTFQRITIVVCLAVFDANIGGQVTGVAG